jgi:lipooligosaccharide transport system permease protein
MRFFPVWQRNFLVWKKLAVPSILGNLADPLLYMLGLGYGLGQFLGEIDGVPYLTFLAAGTLAYSVMNSATFETLYSAFSRMHVQKTWDAILNTPSASPTSCSANGSGPPRKACSRGSPSCW